MNSRSSLLERAVWSPCSHTPELFSQDGRWLLSDITLLGSKSLRRAASRWTSATGHVTTGMHARCSAHAARKVTFTRFSELLSVNFARIDESFAPLCLCVGP